MSWVDGVGFVYGFVYGFVTTFLFEFIISRTVVFYISAGIGVDCRELAPPDAVRGIIECW
jgi:hypothetical protein